MLYKVLLFLLFISFWDGINAQTAFHFQGQDVLPGTKEHFLISISDGSDSTFIPITVFQGAENGPVLGITAGVHGYEYPPIIAGQVLIGQINPTQLKGTVILVQVANIAGFLGRSPYVNPLDGKNLNRIFPGKIDGSITEQIAHFISQNIIGRADYFLDMHGGDAPEDLMPYCAYYHNDLKPEASDKGKAMALSLGFDYVIIFRSTGKDYVKEEYPSLYCSAEAFKRGIPSVDIECGKLGGAEPQDIQKIVESVKNLLTHLQMSDIGAPKMHTPILIHDRASLISPQEGIFYSDKRSGHYVSKGMEIGYITDFFGNTLEKVKAPEAGVILYKIGTPPVNKGETLVVIGKVDLEKL